MRSSNFNVAIGATEAAYDTSGIELFEREVIPALRKQCYRSIACSRTIGGGTRKAMPLDLAAKFSRNPVFGVRA